MKRIIVILIFSMFIIGCVDFSIEKEICFIDTAAVSNDGKVALCLDEDGACLGAGDDMDVYITNLQGGSFVQVTENETINSSVAWSFDGMYLLYTEKAEDVWKLNLYSVSERETINLLQEMYYIALPRFSDDLENISYMVFPDENVPIGHLNVYEKGTSSIYTLAENIYYDYIWMPDRENVIVVSVTEEFEEVFQGSLIVKDAQGFTEDIIFNGYFDKKMNALDMTADGKNIIFRAGDKEVSGKLEIYLYNIEGETLTKWSGPEGYEFRLPAPGLRGYILAHVKGHEDGWGGQLYLVSLDKRIIEVPGWPLWIQEPNIAYMDLYEGTVFVLNLDTNETVNLTERFVGIYGQQED